MAAKYHYDETLHAVRVTLTGDVTAKVIKSVFEELYLGKYPGDVNAIWLCLDCSFDISVMDILQLAKFTQSQREFEGYPATAFVADTREVRDLCEEYKLMVSEAPYDVEIFETLKGAEGWLQERAELNSRG